MTSHDDAMSEDAHKYSHMPDHSSSYQFPVALSGISPTDTNWSSLFAEPNDAEEEMTPDTHVMLHSLAEHDWDEVLVRLFQVANLLPWQLFVAATILVNYFYISYVNHFVLDRPPPRLFTEMYFTDLVYLADLVLTVTPGFLKTIQDKMSFSKRSRLAVFTDVFTLLPLEQSYYFAVRRDASISVLYFLRSITFIRGYRIVVYFQQWGRTAGSSHWKIFLAKYFLYLSVVVHMVTCVWFSLGCKHDCHRLAGLDEQLSQLDSWIYIVGSFTLSIKTAAQWYFVCFYFSLVTIANCGLGDLHATNRYEMLTCIVAMWAGFALIIGVYVGSLTSHLVNKTRRRALFSEKLHAINNYLTDIKMDLGPQREILKYYEVMWKKKKGIKSATEVDLLPLPLQMEVFFDINIARFVSSLIFCGRDESFLRRLSLYMKNEFYLPGETVYYQDVAKPKMVCISSGILEVLSDEDGESPIISLTTGTCLGEVALGLTVPAKSSVRAATYTELQVLYKVDFLRMMADYPEIHRNIRELIKFRYVSAYDKEISTNRNEVLISLFVSQTREVTPIKNLKDNLRKSQGLFENDRDDHVEFNPIISDTSPYRYLYVIAGKNSNREYQTTYLTKTLPWIIHPSAQILVVWEYVMFVTILFISIAYPYYCAFERKFPEWLSNTCILVDVLFVVDIFLQCTTAVEKKEVFITRPMHIIDYRLNSPGLYLDVFAIFPIEVMAYMITPAKRGERIYWVLKLNRLLKSWRIPAFFYNHEKDLWARLVFMRIVKYILFFALCAHWAGVLLYMEACFYGYCDQESWFAANMDLEIDNRDKSPAYVSPCVVSIYFALSLLSGVGLGDFLPESNPDVCFTCFYIVLGVLLFGYCIAEFSATFTHISRTRVEYHSIVVAIKKFMEGNSLGSAIMDRVLNYYQLQWNYNGGVSVVQDNPLLADASYEIQRQVLAQECIVTLQSVPLFQHVNADFVQLVATSARVLVLPPNEIITYAGGLSREMYVIQEGFCEIISGNTGLTESLVGPNSHFGDIEMLHGIPSLVNVRTVTHCKVISIDYASYAQVISMFPHILKENESVMNIFNIKEMVKNSKFNRFSDRKKPYCPEKNKLNWRKGLNFHNFKYNISSIFEDSFVDVRNKCRENGEEYYSPFDSLRKWRFIKFLLFPYCVSPNGNFIKVYCIVRTIAAIVVGFIQPFHQSIMPFDLNIDGLVTLLDIIAYVDLYVCMHVGYFNEMGVLVTHPLYTAKHYLQHNFVIDLLACFPFSYVIYSLQSAEDDDDESPANTLQNVAHLNVVLQLYRLPLGVQYLEGNILQKADIIRVFKYVILTIVLINTCTSLLVSVDCEFLSYQQLKENQINEDDQELDTDYGHVHIQVDSSKYGIMICKPGSWLDESHYKGLSDPREIYMVAFYWSAGSLLGIGFGDVSAQERLEMIVTMVIMIVGTLLFGYMSANIACSTASIHNTLSSYQEMMTELRDFMKQESVDRDLEKRVVEHFEYEWKRTAGIEANLLANKLHTALKEDTVLLLYERTLREVPLFENVDSSFFRIVGTEMREEYFLRGETIIRSNDVQSDLFIIHRGKVEVLSSYNEMLACMGAGGIFGNISSVSAASCSVTIVASRNLDVLVIKSEVFYNILKQYPSVNRKIETVLKMAKDFIVPATISGVDSSDISIQVQDSNISGDELGTVGMTTSAATVRTNVTMTTMGTVRTTATSATLFHPRGWLQFAILPDSVIFNILSYIVLFASYINCWLVSYCFVFQDHSLSLVVLGFSIDVIFYLKIFLELHEAYLDKYGEYVVDLKKIRKRYFSRRYRVLLDVIANVPISVLAYCAPYGHRSYTLSFLRLLHLLRFKYIFHFYEARSNILSVNRLYLKSSTIVIWLTMLAHLFSCAMYMIVCPMAKCLEYSWTYHAELAIDATPMDSYILTVYFVATLFTTTAFGDVVAHSSFELLLVVSMMIVSKFAIAVFIGDITSVFNSYSSTLVNYEYDILELRDFLKNQGLSDHPMEKMWNYVQLLWTYGRGKQMPRFVLRAPFVLRCDLMNEMYGDHLRNSFIFHNTDEDFLRQLTVRLKRYMFFKGNYIVQHGDTDQNMYFIHRGEVEILTVHSNLTETIHVVLKPGDMFGVAQGLYHGLPHHFSFRAKSVVVDILSLNLDSWYYMLRYFPDVKGKVYQRANNMFVSM